MVNLKYAISALMALTIFFIMLSIINFLDTQRLMRFTNDVMAFSTETEDLAASMRLLQSEGGNESCAIIDAAYAQKTSTVNGFMEKMLSYERANLFAEFFSLKRQFLISNIGLWQVSKLQKEYCPSSHVDV